jgi:predicted dehydrogenase
MIKVAVIGAGHWGPNLIRNFHDAKESEVTWVADTADARLEMVRSRFPGVKTTKDAKELLASSDVDAVVIATPTVTHYELVARALEAKKHVLVEKPITTKSEEGERLVALAAKQDRVLMVGHVFLYNGAVQRVKKYIDDGELGGRIYYVSMVRTNLGPIRMDVSAAWDLASHDISIVDYWLGATPVAVSAVGHDWINPGMEDAVFATLRYPSDVLVNLHASWLNPRKARDITVVGDGKMLTFDDMNSLEPIRIYDKRVTDEVTRPSFVDSITSFRAGVRNGDITIPPVSTGEPLKNECMEFLRCVSSGDQPASNGAFATNVVRTLEAMDRSMANGGREEQVG